MNHRVQDIMKRVRASKCLGKAPRQTDLLQYLLTEKEQGRLNKITQYSIAIDVLGRSDNFDPSTDSIVRGEMHRLRKNLELFNSDSKDVQLVIPRASFEVVVTDKTKTSNAPFLKTYQKPLAYAATAMIVSAFGLFSVTPNTQNTITASNCSSIIPNVSVVNSGGSADLQLYVGKVIRSSVSQYTSIQLVDDIGDCSNSGTPSFTLDYMVFEKNGTYRVALTTYNEQPANIVGFKNIGGVIATPDDKDDLYYSVVKSVGDLAKPYGKISRHAVTRNWSTEEIANNYKCMLTMYDSHTSDSSEDFLLAKSCLTNTAKSKFATIDNKGGLAMIYIVEYRQTPDGATSMPMLAAKKLIEGANEEWINSAEMTMAKILYEVDRPDYNAERLETLLNAAEKHYGENPHILITVAIYTGFKLDDWDRAKHLSSRIPLIHSERDNSVFLVDAAFELINAQSDVDLETCLLAYSENSLFSNLLVNSCARRNQNEEWVDKTNDNLTKLDFFNEDKRVQYIKSRKFAPSVSSSFISSLRLSVN